MGRIVFNAPRRPIVVSGRGARSDQLASLQAGW